MAEKHLQSPSSLTMVVSGGIFLIGKFKNGKLSNPRGFSVIDNGAKYMMSPLPGNPSFVQVRVDIQYAIPWGERNIVDLYERVTRPPLEVVPPVTTAQ